MDNPEKIPLNPIHEGKSQTPYSNLGDESATADQPIWRRLGGRKSVNTDSQIQFTAKQKLLLGMVLVVLLLAAFIAGAWLFHDQLNI